MSNRRAARVLLIAAILVVAAPAATPAPSVPDILPGGGFTGPTAQPPAVGSGAGVDAKAIARWDVVPFQTVTEKLPVGVVAFHIDGIDRVEFSANGGAWVATNTLTLNSVSHAWEYCANVDPADFPDGRVEVRAVVYPKVGVPRVLGGAIDATSIASGEHSLILHADHGGTLTLPERFVDSAAGSDGTGTGTTSAPFRTVFRALQDIQQTAASGATALNGATVYLKAGNYNWGGSSSPIPVNGEHWATIRPAPGVSAADVVFTSGDDYGLYATYLHVQDCTIDGDFLLSTAGNGTRYLWLDGCSMTGPGGLNTNRPPYRGADFTAVYVTDSSISKYFSGGTQAALDRNVRVSDIESDAFSNTLMVVNCFVDVITATDPATHADLYQLFGPNNAGTKQNLIVYGVKAVNSESQGIFVADLTSLRDIAFVNVLFARPPADKLTDPPFSQWGVPTNHALLWGCSLPNSTFYWGTSNLQNVSIVGCVFGKIMNDQSFTLPDAWFSHNHFVDVTSWPATQKGTDATSGDPGYVDPAANDYRPTATSVLRNRIPAPVLAVDVDGVARSAPDTVGATTVAGAAPPPPPPPPPPVESFLVPTRVVARPDAAHPERSSLVVEGMFDTGPAAVDLTRSATLIVGGFPPFDIPALLAAKNRKSLSYAAPGLSLALTPAANGSSRVHFKLVATGDLTGRVDADGDLAVGFTQGAVHDAGTVRLVAGRYARGAVRGAFVAPALYVRRSRATVRGTDRDALTTVLGFATDGVVPGVAPALTIGFGDTFTTSIPSASFRRRGGRYVFRGPAPGITSAVIDYAHGTITVSGKAMTLGTFASGPQPVPVSVDLGGDSQSVRVRMLVAGPRLVY